MKTISKLATLGLLLFALFPAIAAQAEDCARADYCKPHTPDNDGTDEETEVVPPSTENPPSGGATEVVGGGAEVEGEAETAPSGSLPITGADVIGIAALGAAALGLGTVLVRRSRSMKNAA